MKTNFLSVKDGRIVSGDTEIKLRGVNFGGWLMMEGYILGGRNIPEKSFREQLSNEIGIEDAEKFKWEFADNFIQESDIRNVKRLGFNVVRVPVNYKFFENEKGWEYFDSVVKIFEDNNLYLIIDMHSAPGCQNPDWHCDSWGEVELFDSEKPQKQLVSLWGKIAKRYKDKAIIAGYDILNESVTPKVKEFNNLYRAIVKEIRSVGDKHILFLEGNQWGSDLECLEDFDDDNIVYSVHFYRPMELAFNMMPNLVYPGIIGGEKWDKSRLRLELKSYKDFSAKKNAPILVGEFGVSTRCVCCKHELAWVKDVVDVFEEFGFHWTYWTYKAVGIPFLPNGIYQLFNDPFWLRRFAPIFGWERIPMFLKENYTGKQELLNSIKTEKFQENCDLLKILQSAEGVKK